MPATRSRILLWAALSGVLWALAWPAIGGFTWFAFIAWLPLLYAERLHEHRTKGRRAFVPYALLALFIWNLSCSWWFWCVSEPFATRLISISAPVVVNTLLMALPWYVKRLVYRTMGPRMAVFAFVVSWLAFERLHHDWDLQWPWLSIGNVFGTRPEMVQWYEFTGMLGGSLWVLLSALFIDRVITRWRMSRRVVLMAIGPAAVVIVLPWIVSLWRFGKYPIGLGHPVEVVVVQPNIDPYSQKFGGMEALEQVDRMLDLAAERTTGNTALIVFPETALQEGATVDMRTGELVLNGLWENDLEASRSAQRLRRFQSEHPRAALLTGMSSDRVLERSDELPSTARPLGDNRHWYESYNAALWMPSRGPITSYHKSKLVAGVELMPFEEVLGPLGELALDLGGTTGSLGQQEERAVLRDATRGLAVIPVICYESVFGEHVAAHVRNGGNLIAIMTNDGWWDDSPGYHQHLTFASLRAIETRRDVVRSANTGTSCTVDQRGVVHDRTSWWQPTAFRATVYLNNGVTFFVAHGDLIGRTAVPLAMLVLLLAAVRRFRDLRSV